MTFATQCGIAMLNFLLTHATFFKAIGATVAAIGAILKGGPKLLDAIRTWLDRRYLVKHLGARKFTPDRSGSRPLITSSPTVKT